MSMSRVIRTIYSGNPTSPKFHFVRGNSLEWNGNRPSPLSFRLSSSEFRIKARKGFASSEVPEGRHNVAHRGSGGDAAYSMEEPRRGGTMLTFVPPLRGSSVPSRPPTAPAVGYVLPPLTGL